MFLWLEMVLFRKNDGKGYIAEFLEANHKVAKLWRNFIG
jgi:hypothetical protein